MKIDIKEFLPFGAYDLQKLSENWNRSTVERVIPFKGEANMFGGSESYVHVQIHGENSVFETNSVTVKGYIEYDYNIERGANGPTSSVARYYKDTDEADPKPVCTVSITGVTTADAAICAALYLTKDFKK